MSSRAMAPWAAAVAAAVLLAACGGDDSANGGNGGGEKALSKAEYIKQGDAICAQGDRQVEEAAKEAFSDLEGGRQPSAKEVGEFAQAEVLPNLERQLDRLRELPAPEGDQDEVTAIYDAAEKGVEELAAAPPEDFATKGDAAFEDANRLAGEYGFQTCGGQGG